MKNNTQNIHTVSLFLEKSSVLHATTA